MTMDGINKFRKTIDAILLMPNKDAIMEQLTTDIDVYMADIKVSCPDCYWKLYRKLHEIVYDCHFSEGMAKWAVSQMINDDGTKGEHWNIVDTTAVAASAGIMFSPTTFNEWDWYFTLNMMYSDYYKYLSSNTEAYVNLAKLYLTDVDVPVGKAYKYWTYVVKG